MSVGNREEGATETVFDSNVGLFDDDGNLGEPDSSKDTRIEFHRTNDPEQGGSDHVDDSDNVATVSDSSPTFVHRGEEIGSIEKDKIFQYDIGIDEPAILEYQLVVTDGPDIDVVVVDREGLEDWINGDSPRYFSNLSALATREVRVQERTSPGDKYLVLDNSAMGKAKPPVLGDSSDATVEFELKYAVYR